MSDFWAGFEKRSQEYQQEYSSAPQVQYPQPSQPQGASYLKPIAGGALGTAALHHGSKEYNLADNALKEQEHALRKLPQPKDKMGILDRVKRNSEAAFAAKNEARANAIKELTQKVEHARGKTRGYGLLSLAGAGLLGGSIYSGYKRHQYNEQLQSGYSPRY